MKSDLMMKFDIEKGVLLSHFAKWAETLPTADLTELEVDEISLVDRPANPGSRVILFKRDAGGSLTARAERLNAMTQRMTRIWPR